jgi:hypothetical protein
VGTPLDRQGRSGRERGLRGNTMSAERPSGPCHLDEPVRQAAGEDVAAEQPGSIQRLYDTALERTAVDGSPASQRYLSVLLAAS